MAGQRIGGDIRRGRDAARAVTMEVYAVTREFSEWGKGFYNRLPAAVRNSLRSSGICHFLVVVKDEDGRLRSFDFGPLGGDVAGLPGLGSGLGSGLDSVLERRDAMDMSSIARDLPLMRRSKSDSALLDTAARSTGDEERSFAAAGALQLAFAASCAGSSDDDVSPCEIDTSRCATPSPSPSPKGRFHRVASTSVIASATAPPKSRWSRLQRRARKTATEGEIRETVLDALPEGAHYVGETNLSLDEIRDFNEDRCLQYLLHDNDCRHYVNDLCSHLVPLTAGQLKNKGGVASRVSWQSAWQRVKQGRPHEALVVLPLQAFADLNNQSAVQRIKHAASAFFAFGLGMRVVPFLAPTLGLQSSVAAAFGTFARAAPTRRLVTTAAGAVASVSAETPVVREAIVFGHAAMGSAIDVTRGVAKGTGQFLQFAANGMGLGGGGGGSVASATATATATNGAFAGGSAFARGAKAGEFVANAGASIAAGATVGAAVESKRSADHAWAVERTLEVAGPHDSAGVDRCAKTSENLSENVIAGRDERPGRVPAFVGRVGRAAVNGWRRVVSPGGANGGRGVNRKTRAAGTHAHPGDASLEGAVPGVPPPSPKRKHGRGFPRGLRFDERNDREAKARRFDVRRVFRKSPSSENLALQAAGTSSTHR